MLWFPVDPLSSVMQGLSKCPALDLGSSGPVLGIAGSALEVEVEYTFRLTVSQEGMPSESTVQRVGVTVPSLTLNNCLAQVWTGCQPRSSATRWLRSEGWQSSRAYVRFCWVWTPHLTHEVLLVWTPRLAHIRQVVLGCLGLFRPPLGGICSEFGAHFKRSLKLNSNIYRLDVFIPSSRDFRFWSFSQ